MKKILAIALVLFASLNMASAQSSPRAKVLCGPYVQCMSETGFTVIWTTDVDAVMDGKLDGFIKAFLMEFPVTE